MASLKCKSLVAPLLAVSALLPAGSTFAEPPGVAYIFPAGAQRGTKVDVRVGGFYFHGQAQFEMDGTGVTAAPVVKEVPTIWFEGPPVNEPESQKKEDYPKDHHGEITLAKDAPLGLRRWYCRTSQGVIPAMKFVVGDLPEMVEREIDGAPIPQSVTLPLTINGRIFPREDVDQWRFHVEKGQAVCAEVASQGLGYPLQSALEVTGPKGSMVPGQRKQRTKNGDPMVQFTAPATGEYQVAIHDASYTGGQNFVYRLTVTTAPRLESYFPLGGRRGGTVQVKYHTTSGVEAMVPVTLSATSGDFATQAVSLDGHLAGVITLHIDDLTEYQEGAAEIVLPAMLNGRIEKPGQTDEWPVTLEKGQMLQLGMLAAKLGSRLDSVVTIHGPDGKELARNDDQVETNPDSRLIYTATAAGIHTVKVADRFASRGGSAFGYRLRASLLPAPDFELTLTTDAYNTTRQTEADIAPVDPAAPKKPAVKVPGWRVDLVPLGAFAKDITLEVEGLPEGVKAEPVVLNTKKKFAEIQFTAPPRTPIQAAKVRIIGKSEVDGKPVTRRATFPVAFGEPAMEELRLGIVPAVPFKHVGHYVFVNDQGGGTLGSKHYLLERGGFEGPLTVSFSDRQIRYLRGVSGDPLVLPPGATEFNYTVKYPVDIEQGHTSRTQLMVVGELVDFDGSRHMVSYTSSTNDEQLVCSTTAGPLRVLTASRSYPALAGGKVAIPVTIQRGPVLGRKPVELSLEIPAHVSGVSAASVTVPANEDRGILTLEFGQTPGPFNMPVVIAAKTTDAAGLPCRGETRIEFVPSPAQASR